MKNEEWGMGNGGLHPVRDASLGRNITVILSLHAVGMHPYLGRIPMACESKSDHSQMHPPNLILLRILPIFVRFKICNE